MRQVKPHERPDADDMQPILHHRATVPALCWVMAIVIIVVSGWLDTHQSIDAMDQAAAQSAGQSVAQSAGQSVAQSAASQAAAVR